MLVTVSPLQSAPQVSGHPSGLPEARPVPPAEVKVTPIADARNPEAGLRDGKAPTKFWRAVNGEPDPATHAAPPSIMQITISQMLDEQSPARQREKTPPADDARSAGQDPARDMPEDSPDDPARSGQERADQPEAPTLPRKSVFKTLP